MHDGLRNREKDYVAAPMHDKPWTSELNDLLRGLTGGFLIGIPLLYTMESWWIGQIISMPRALLLLLLAYALNLAFVLFTGFRAAESGSHHPFGDALEATALAIVASAVTLALLHQVRLDQPLNVVAGRIAFNTLPISLGVSIANHILAPRETRTDSPDEGTEVTSSGMAFIVDLGAAFAGALFLSLNIAVTEEIPMLATEVPTLMLAALIAFSLLVSYAIVFEAGLGNQEARRGAPGPFQRPVTETVVAYVVSLATCAGMLMLFGQIEPGSDPLVAYDQVVVLGLPASIGAAAGRLAV